MQPSSRTLIIMRHAQAVDSHPKGNFYRPLATPGHDQATAAAHHLKALGHVPQQIICSAATRTRETASLMKEAWGEDIPTIATEDIFKMAHGEPPYNRSFDLVAGFNDILTEADDTKNCLLVIGHNPDIANFVHVIGTELPQEVGFQYPPATAVVFDVSQPSWSSLKRKSHRCQAVILGGTQLIQSIRQSAPEAE